MSTFFSSVETIVLFSGSILAAAVTLWALCKIYGFVGFPIGRLSARIPSRTVLDTQEKEDFQCAVYGIITGGFLCYGLIIWNFMNPVGFPQYSLPDRRVYDITFWVIKTTLQACGESIAVLAILSGVVKVCGLDGKREESAGTGKEQGRLA